MAIQFNNNTNTLTASGGSGTLSGFSVTSLSTASGSAPSYSARAWVNFNGTGTVAIRASGNVSSITDNGTGDYTVNLTTAMSDADYDVACSANAQGYTQISAMPFSSGYTSSAPSSSAFRVFTGNYVAAVDCLYVTAAVFR